jgi:carbamoyl-phosphate synthase large subunit
LPAEGNIFISANPKNRERVIPLAVSLDSMGYGLLATEGTARACEAAGLTVRHVKKLAEGHPNLLDFLANGEVAMVINTPSGKGARTDEGKIRAAAVQARVPCVTTIEAATAAVQAMRVLREEEMQVEPLQSRFAALQTRVK